MRLPFALSLLLWSSCGAPQLVELDGGSWFRGPGIVLMTLVARDRSVRHLEAWSGDITLTTVEADRVTGSLSVQMKLEDGGVTPFQAEFDAPVYSEARAGTP